MPVSTSTNRDLALFRVNNPDVVAYAETTGIYNRELVYRSLGRLEVNRVLQAIRGDRESGLTEPAREWEAPWLPNGDFRVARDGVYFDFRIHLVQSGSLAGKRIVKVKQPGNSIFTGFAFVDRGGRLNLWRRFLRDLNAPYVRAAKDLLDNVYDGAWEQGEPRNASYVVGAFNRAAAVVMGTSLDSEQRGHWTVTNLRCLHCNAIAVQQSETFPTPFPLCATHATVPAPTRGPDPALQALIDEEDARPHEAATPAAVRRAAQRRSPAARRVSASRSGATQRAVAVPMSQVSGKYVL